VALTELRYVAGGDARNDSTRRKARDHVGRLHIALTRDARPRLRTHLDEHTVQPDGIQPQPAGRAGLRPGAWETAGLRTRRAAADTTANSNP